MLDVLADLAAELDHPELKALKGLLEQAVSTEAALRKEGKTATDEYKAVVEQFKAYSAGINLADKRGEDGRARVRGDGHREVLRQGVRTGGGGQVTHQGSAYR